MYPRYKYKDYTIQKSSINGDYYYCYTIKDKTLQYVHDEGVLHQSLRLSNGIYKTLKQAKQAIRDVETSKKSFYKVVGLDIKSWSCFILEENKVLYKKNEYVRCSKGGYLAVFDDLEAARICCNAIDGSIIYRCQCLGETNIASMGYDFSERFAEKCRLYRAGKKSGLLFGRRRSFVYVDKVKLLKRVY